MMDWKSFTLKGIDQLIITVDFQSKCFTLKLFQRLSCKTVTFNSKYSVTLPSVEPTEAPTIEPVSIKLLSPNAP